MKHPWPSLGLALVLCCAAVMPAEAAAPLARTQAPAFHRTMVGDVEITALGDGTIALPATKLLHGPSVGKRLADAHLGETVETSVNAFVVNIGERLVLVDAGTGTLMGPTLGRLVVNLRAAGYAPEQVDDVLVTHAHPDHVGGLVSDGRRVFPNATVHLEDTEAAYWLSPERGAAAPDAVRPFFAGAVASLSPYAEAGRLDRFSPGATPVPGIRTLASHGHTAGHTVYVVESRGQTLWLIGDLIHVGDVQFPAPRTTIGFDTDEPAAAATRIRLFRMAARTGVLIGAAHLPFPGFGRIARDGDAFRWMPLPWSASPTP